ncbi:hypothetical protein MHBO_004069 [Bonamia ostreae]|uniref:Uncharacterized protein n=1 Tax=Bonamia ostreae TaxID=126728 RepID=A0ABV2ASK9_9EUKA
MSRLFYQIMMRSHDKFDEDQFTFILEGLLNNIGDPKLLKSNENCLNIASEIIGPKITLKNVLAHTEDYIDVTFRNF